VFWDWSLFGILVISFYWQASRCHSGFNNLFYRQLSANFMVITTILFTHTTFRWATSCLICFIPNVKPFLLVLTTVRNVYLIWKYSSQQMWWVGMGFLHLLGIWSHLWYIQRSAYAHSQICISYRTYKVDCSSLFMSFHMINLLSRSS
jgi:hypothetical protein